MTKIRSLRAVPFLVVVGALSVACGGKDFAPNLAGPSRDGFGESVLIAGPEGGGGELVSPASVTVRIQDTNGGGFTLLGVDAAFRSAGGAVLAREKWTKGAVIPAHGTGEASLDLSWKPPTAAARYLDLSVTVRDSAGVSHVLDTTLDGTKTGQWLAW